MKVLEFIKIGNSNRNIKACDEFLRMLRMHNSVNRRKKVDKIIERIWGSEPYGLVSMKNLADIGSKTIFSLQEIVEEEYPEAAKKITNEMIVKLLVYIILKPWNLGYAVKGTEMIVGYALNERTTEEDAKKFETMLGEYGKQILEEGREYFIKNNKKGFKWSNISGIYA